jgi:hypothetical protein
MTMRERNYRQLLETTMQIAERNCSELVMLRIAVERAVSLLRFHRVEEAQDLLETAYQKIRSSDDG